MQHQMTVSHLPKMAQMINLRKILGHQTATKAQQPARQTTRYLEASAIAHSRKIDLTKARLRIRTVENCLDEQDGSACRMAEGASVDDGMESSPRLSSDISLAKFEDG